MADMLQGLKPPNNSNWSKVGHKQVEGVRGKIAQKYRKTCIFDLILSYFAPNPFNLFLTYF